MKTKSDGLSQFYWVLQLLEQAKQCGYEIDTEKNATQINYFYNNDYSAEDAWQDIFDEMDIEFDD